MANLSVLEFPGRARDPVPGDAAARARPKIVITHEEHLVIDQAVSALREEPKLFQRAGMLVWLLDEKKTRRHRIDRRPGGKRIVALHHSQLRRLLTIHAQFCHWVTNSKNERVLIPAHPPAWAVEGVATLGAWPGIRALEGIVEAPTLRPDGSLIHQAGYDSETGLWLEPDGDFPDILAQPTMVEVWSSVVFLHGIVRDFPFIPDPAGELIGPHCAARLAALLTALARPASPTGLGAPDPVRPAWAHRSWSLPAST